eukprot:6479922-Amphidinium_carterae.1
MRQMRCSSSSRGGSSYSGLQCFAQIVASSSDLQQYALLSLRTFQGSCSCLGLSSCLNMYENVHCLRLDNKVIAFILQHEHFPPSVRHGIGLACPPMGEGMYLGEARTCHDSLNAKESVPTGQTLKPNVVFVVWRPV